MVAFAVAAEAGTAAGAGVGACTGWLGLFCFWVIHQPTIVSVIIATMAMMRATSITVKPCGRG